MSFPRLSLSFMLVALVGPGQVFAQTPPSQPGAFRQELKGPGGGVAVSVMGASVVVEPSTVVCEDNGVCRAPVFVFRGGKGSDGRWDPRGCSVYVPYARMKTTEGNQPTLRWVIVKDPADSSTYGFDAADGIKILSGPNGVGGTYTTVDPSRDIYFGRAVENRTAYEWRNINNHPDKTRSLNFVPHVHRTEAGKNVRGCDYADPEIFNEN